MGAMTPKLWKQMNYFSPEEEWGDPRMIEADLVIVLEVLREAVGHPFAVHCAYATRGHEPGSQHYIRVNKDGVITAYCKAGDGHFEGVRLNQGLVDVIVGHLKRITVGQVRERFPGFMAGVAPATTLAAVVGLGIYPHWSPTGGIHLDVRGYKSRWGALNRSVPCPRCKGAGEVGGLKCARCKGAGKVVTQVYVTFEEAYAAL